MSEFQYTVKEEDIEKDIKKLLREKFDFSSRLRSKIKQGKLVLLNGEPVDGWIRPQAGDILTVLLPEENSNFPPQKIPLDIVYEDSSLLIINKQPGLIVHPTKGHVQNTLANGIMQYLLDTNQSFKIRFINRLDMDTSGLVAVAKNSLGQADYMKQDQAGNVKKCYLAVVKGAVKEDSGIIDLPIGHADPERVERAVVLEGRPSVTHFEVLERFATGYSLLELKPETGRTHQIRVHLSHIGYPILGDYLYGGSNAFFIERQALHAVRLSFPHPITRKLLELEAPMPEDMKALIQGLQK